MGRCRFFNSVSVFGILFGMFSKSVRFSVSVFFNTAVSVRFFGLKKKKFSLSIDSKQYRIHTEWGRPIRSFRLKASLLYDYRCHERR
jgi:hypothetical protein